MSARTVGAPFFGHRLRFARRQAGLTLDQLGQAVGHPPSYLSQLENGHREPRVSTVAHLAAALGCSAADLVDPTPPSRRAELEVALAQMQELPGYRELRLPYLRPSARLDDTALEHIVTLFEQLQAAAPEPGGEPLARTTAAGHSDGPVHARCVAANATMRQLMRQQDNYVADIELAAREALDAAGYPGTGALSERNLTDLAAHFGFTISRVQDLPPSARSITDVRHRIIYVPQRNTATTRDARSVICQTLGHFALGHPDPVDFEGYVRQRVETNYFAGAVLAPEVAVVELLRDAKQRRDISVEDLNGVFYVSYEMAAHRLTNLITRHLNIPMHFLRSDPDGVLWKAYENDGFPLPADAEGIIEGKRCCQWSSARQAIASEDSYSSYYQYTETPAGTYWCATHIEIERDRGDAVTVGTSEANARWFRGHDTTRRFRSRCPDPECCRRPSAEQARRWEGKAWPSAADHSHFVSGLPTDTFVFSPHPGVELTDVYSFLDRQGTRRPTPAAQAVAARSS
ncbi:MAG: family transcriptional regulator, fatty acid utilization regulator [Actinomycetota bacterium]|jgi:predicted transcriptional regulator/transcriptional regulator with XRE-family HTH domain|nr:family transcriptional regulator, fatty acid utilization regulator [Actinomycetota bacterium]